MRFCFDIPDAKAGAIIDAFCERHGYEDTIENDAGEPVPNPQPKATFFKERVLGYIGSSARQAMLAQVIQGADASARARIDEDTRL